MKRNSTLLLKKLSNSPSLLLMMNSWNYMVSLSKLLSVITPLVSSSQLFFFIITNHGIAKPTFDLKGRYKWDAWTKLKGKSTLAFVK